VKEVGISNMQVGKRRKYVFGTNTPRRNMDDLGKWKDSRDERV